MHIDRVHFYVEDAVKWRNWFQRNLYFQSGGSEITQDTHTEIVQAGEIQFYLSAPRNLHSPVARFLQEHPPGLVDLAFQVRDVSAVLERAVTAGAEIIQEIYLDRGRKSAKISAWGTLSHTLVETLDESLGQDLGETLGEDRSPTFPTLETNDRDAAPPSPYLCIDHLVLNVPQGELAKAAQWYQDIFQLQSQQEFRIQTENSGLYSQVLCHPASGLQIPINEPTSNNSQIQEFLDLNHGAGIQHLALKVKNIIPLVAALRGQELDFLEIPSTYYKNLATRTNLPLDSEELRSLTLQNILVDWQPEAPESLLLQIFTQPIFPQPTFFFELIERRSQAQGFGAGNFQALFTAMEQEQIDRQKMKNLGD